MKARIPLYHIYRRIEHEGLKPSDCEGTWDGLHNTYKVLCICTSTSNTIFVLGEGLGATFGDT